MKICVVCCLLAGSLAFGQSPAILTPGSPVKPAPPAATPADIPPDTIVAKANGKNLTAADVKKLTSGLPPNVETAYQQNPKKVLGTLLMMRYLSDLAVKNGDDQKSPTKEQLEFQTRSFLAQTEINVQANAVKVTPEEEQKYYADNKAKYESAKIRVIYLPFVAKTDSKPDESAKKSMSEAEAKAKAEDLVKKIRAGGDFVKAVHENSEDEDSKKKDGEYGSIKRTDTIPEEIMTAVFTAKAGTITDPVRQNNGFYIFRVDEKSPIPFAEVREKIYNDMKQTRFREFMEGIQKQYDVEVANPAFFAPKPPAPAAGTFTVK